MKSIQDYYAQNPLMVSSPFGGIDSINAALLDEVLSRLQIEISTRHILDVGCGRGFLDDYIEQKGGRYTGLDMISSRAGVSMALADASALPFQDETFDAVFCVDAFEHFVEAARCAREFRRVLRPGGYVFLSVPNYANVAGVVKWYCERLGRYDRDSWAPFRNWQAQVHESMMRPRRVRGTFRRAGFARFRRIGHGDEVLLGLLPWAAHRRCPESILYRLQRLFGKIGPAIAVVFPTLSLHNFWKIEV